MGNNNQNSSHPQQAMGPNKKRAALNSNDRSCLNNNQMIFCNNKQNQHQGSRTHSANKNDFQQQRNNHNSSSSGPTNGPNGGKGGGSGSSGTKFVPATTQKKIIVGAKHHVQQPNGGSQNSFSSSNGTNQLRMGGNHGTHNNCIGPVGAVCSARSLTGWCPCCWRITSVEEGEEGRR